MVKVMVTSKGLMSKTSVAETASKATAESSTKPVAWSRVIWPFRSWLVECVESPLIWRPVWTPPVTVRSRFEIFPKLWCSTMDQIRTGLCLLIWFTMYFPGFKFWLVGNLWTDLILNSDCYRRNNREGWKLTLLHVGMLEEESSGGLSGVESLICSEELSCVLVICRSAFSDILPVRVFRLSVEIFLFSFDKMLEKLSFDSSRLSFGRISGLIEVDGSSFESLWLSSIESSIRLGHSSGK